MTRGLVIRTRELGGKIVALGTDAARGITVEEPDFQSDDAGPSVGTFTLKRSPRVQWMDLRAFAPIVVTQRGVPIWRGRIKQTPMTDGGLARQIGVLCEGQQFHLDDDPFERVYVDADLGRWKDWRSSTESPLGAGLVSANGLVTAEGGSITLAFGKGVVLTTNDTVAVLYDAGPAAALRRWTIWLQTSNNAAYMALYFSHMANENAAGATVLQSQTLTAWGAGTGVSYTIPAGNRYLLAQMQYTDPGGTLGVDVWVRFMQMIEYAETAYETSNASVLKASDVVGDALNRGTMLLSSDRSLIVPTSFSIPDLAPATPVTARELISAVNAYHRYQFRVRADNRPEFRPYPSKPVIEVGSECAFAEASAGDASEVYTGVIVAYTDPAGVEQRVYRSQQSSTYQTSATQPTNPGAEAATTGWAASAGGTLTRTTVGGEFSNGVAGFKLAIASPPGGAEASSSAWSGSPFVPGRAHRLTFDVRIIAPVGPGPVWRAMLSVDGVPLASAGTVGTDAFGQGALDWVQPSTTAPVIAIGGGGYGYASAFNVFFDNLVMLESVPTIVNRWGFRRTKVLETGMVLTTAGAIQIADTFLASHRSTPLRGTLVVPGDGLARRSPGGQGMLCAELLNCTGELVRLRHLVDPETGKIGRIGRIASVDWDAAANVASIEIDSTTKNIEAMLARLALITGQVRG